MAFVAGLTPCLSAICLTRSFPNGTFPHCPRCQDVARILTMAVIAVSLAGCDDVHHMLNARYTRPHWHARQLPPAKAEPVKPSVETHDAMVDRVHRESAERRKAYCDSHRDLSIRLGCD
jgi:hypothetical protein